MLSLPRLYAILDVDVATAAGWAPADLARAYFDGGARLLQIRAKRLGSGAFLDLSERVRDLAATVGATVVINDRVDVAQLAGIPAVHVGQDDLPVAAARALLGPTALLGFSTHTPEQIAAAVHLPIDYLAVGPVFDTTTKSTGYTSVGFDRIRYAVQLERERRQDEAEASYHSSTAAVAVERARPRGTSARIGPGERQETGGTSARIGPGERQETGRTSARIGPGERQETGGTSARIGPGERQETGGTSARIGPGERQETGRTSARIGPGERQETVGTSARIGPGERQETGGTSARIGPGERQETGGTSARVGPGERQETGGTSARVGPGERQETGGTSARVGPGERQETGGTSARIGPGERQETGGTKLQLGYESRPIVAIGGITLERAREVIDAGASSVAVISDLLTGGDPQARVRAFLESLR